MPTTVWFSQNKMGVEPRTARGLGSHLHGASCGLLLRDPCTMEPAHLTRGHLTLKPWDFNFLVSQMSSSEWFDLELYLIPNSLCNSGIVIRARTPSPWPRWGRGGGHTVLDPGAVLVAGEVDGRQEVDHHPAPVVLRLGCRGDFFVPGNRHGRQRI